MNCSIGGSAGSANINCAQQPDTVTGRGGFAALGNNAPDSTVCVNDINIRARQFEQLFVREMCHVFSLEPVFQLPLHIHDGEINIFYKRVRAGLADAGRQTVVTLFVQKPAGTNDDQQQ